LKLGDSGFKKIPNGIFGEFFKGPRKLNPGAVTNPELRFWRRQKIKKKQGCRRMGEDFLLFFRFF
jgi:hypothetical protein